MKARLKYNLEDAEDRLAHLRAVKADDMYFSLWDITHNTKKALGWRLDETTLTAHEVLDLVYEKIYEILEEHNINVDELG